MIQSDDKEKVFQKRKNSRRDFVSEGENFRRNSISKWKNSRRDFILKQSTVTCLEKGGCYESGT